MLESGSAITENPPKKLLYHLPTPSVSGHLRILRCPFLRFRTIPESLRSHVGMKNANDTGSASAALMIAKRGVMYSPTSFAKPVEGARK
jgi:hypothetical protein